MGCGRADVALGPESRPGRTPHQSPGTPVYLQATSLEQPQAQVPGGHARTGARGQDGGHRQTWSLHAVPWKATPRSRGGMLSPLG